MNDLFGGDDRYADLLARLEALESIVYQTQKAERSKVDEPLNEAWQKWNRYRNGKGWTAESKKLSMNKLRSLAGENGKLAVAIVDQSIERGWTGLFELKTAQDRSGCTTANAAPPPRYKTATEALAKTETAEENHRAWLENQRALGLIQ